MSYLKYNGQYLKSVGSFISGIIPINGVLDFAGANYVLLDSSTGALDMSGAKIIKWKMFLNPGASGQLFHLGLSGKNLTCKVSGGSVTFGIQYFSGQSDFGTAANYPLSELTGYEMECIAYKSGETNFGLKWLQFGGRGPGSLSGSFEGSPIQNYSRIGADGVETATNYLGNAWVWDIEVIDEDAWLGYGATPNTDAGWVDTIGSIDGTVVGSPGIKTIVDPDASANDWFMPSKDELHAMYTNLKAFGVGNFDGTNPIVYWSSSETSASQVWIENFFDGAQASGGTKSSTARLRAARSFTAGIGAYSLRDVGPAGGLIFYIDGGTTYYEAAPKDNLWQSLGEPDGNVWSNVQGTASGATGTAVGTGASNTTLIIGQLGHIYSLADICNKYAIY